MITCFPIFIEEVNLVPLQTIQPSPIFTLLFNNTSGLTNVVNFILFSSSSFTALSFFKGLPIATIAKTSLKFLLHFSKKKFKSPIIGTPSIKILSKVLSLSIIPNSTSLPLNICFAKIIVSFANQPAPQIIIFT